MSSWQPSGKTGAQHSCGTIGGLLSKDEGYRDSSSNICLCEGSEFTNIPKISQAIQHHVRISLWDSFDYLDS